ncbi:hypothetical protein LZ30DRAFT_722629 [Colletotrichum cereale]|nr:hypothetical protein LZ30DRAFT_722629 [Colletotrichum cereale]
MRCGYAAGDESIEPVGYVLGLFIRGTTPYKLDIPSSSRFRQDLAQDLAQDPVLSYNRQTAKPQD